MSRTTNAFIITEKEKITKGEERRKDILFFYLWSFAWYKANVIVRYRCRNDSYKIRN